MSATRGRIGPRHLPPAELAEHDTRGSGTLGPHARFARFDGEVAYSPGTCASPPEIRHSGTGAVIEPTRPLVSNLPLQEAVGLVSNLTSESDHRFSSYRSCSDSSSEEKDSPERTARPPRRSSITDPGREIDQVDRLSRVFAS